MKNKKAIISKFVFFSKLIFRSSVISWCECSGGLWRSTGVCGAGVSPVLGMPPPVSSRLAYHITPAQ